MDPLAARAVARPLLRQIQGRPQHPGAPFRPEQGGRRHLAIGNLAQRATVLARDADGVLALFREAGVVDDHHPCARRQKLQQSPPYRRPIPRRVGDEVLEILVMARVGDPRQHRLHRFARTVSEQALQVAAQRRRLQPGTEGALELLQITQQPTHARPCALIEHQPTAYRNSATRTMSSVQITRI